MIRTVQNPSMCLGKIEGRDIYILLDSGAEISIINMRIFKQFKVDAEIMPCKIDVRSVTGKPIKVAGKARIKFKLGERTFYHEFLIVFGIDKNMILGVDFLEKERVRLCSLGSIFGIVFHLT